MPRGFNAKQARNQKRATEAGHSTRGSSQMGACQQKGKRFKKKEICHSGTQMNILHDGNVYIVYYKMENNNITIQCIVNEKHIRQGEGSARSGADYLIKNEQLLNSILIKFKEEITKFYFLRSQ